MIHTAETISLLDALIELVPAADRPALRQYRAGHVLPRDLPEALARPCYLILGMRGRAPRLDVGASPERLEQVRTLARAAGVLNLDARVST